MNGVKKKSMIYYRIFGPWAFPDFQVEFIRKVAYEVCKSKEFYNG